LCGKGNGRDLNGNLGKNEIDDKNTIPKSQNGSVILIQKKSSGLKIENLIEKNKG
jgi:hypothetical protein